MIKFYRIVRNNGKSLYVKNSRFINKIGMGYHNDDDYHESINEAITKQYLDKSLRTNFEIGNIDAFRELLDGHFSVIPRNLSIFNVKCFFNSLKDLKEWFEYYHIQKFIEHEYILYEYSFAVDFHPSKIYLCDKQSAIAGEYLKRKSTIKKRLDWDILDDVDASYYKETGLIV